MKVPKVGIPFWLYIVVEDSVIGVTLTQVTYGREHIITYFSQRSLTPRQGILLFKSYIYSCFMLFLN
jgi:hypothetical protein